MVFPVCCTPFYFVFSLPSSYNPSYLFFLACKSHESQPSPKRIFKAKANTCKFQGQQLLPKRWLKAFNGALELVCLAFRLPENLLNVTWLYLSLVMAKSKNNYNIQVISRLPKHMKPQLQVKWITSLVFPRFERPLRGVKVDPMILVLSIIDRFELHLLWRIRGPMILMSPSNKD